MKNSTFSLNAYQIHWAIITPSKGIITKRDKAIFHTNGISCPWATIEAHFCSKESLIEKMDSIRGKFSKTYNVLIITDKQFGMSRNGNFTEVATTKQKENIITI